MADRLKEKGLDAHVDGSVKPFRVRIGHYETYADAAKALRDLKARKISGFVSGSNE
jgi:cell division protein FtsN